MTKPFTEAQKEILIKRALESNEGKIELGNVKNMIMLLNANIMENTFIYAFGFSDVLCLPKRRTKFYNDEGKFNTMRFGNAILGFGDADFKKRFYKFFGEIGVIYKQVARKRIKAVKNK